MRKKVSVIDYGIGNILSVRRAFEKIGADTEYVLTPAEIKQADYLILPGVGAFRDGMAELIHRGLDHAIIEYCSQDRPFLGICLGMQMMLQESTEFGISRGLGIIEGRVMPIPGVDTDGNMQKIPHVGWNGLVRAESPWSGTILGQIKENSEVYFVHSYTAVPDDDKYRLADAYYGGQKISAVIKRGKCYGTQFHPEKSGKIGLKILEDFLKL